MMSGIFNLCSWAMLAQSLALLFTHSACMYYQPGLTKPCVSGALKLAMNSKSKSLTNDWLLVLFFIFIFFL